MTTSKLNAVIAARLSNGSSYSDHSNIIHGNLDVSHNVPHLLLVHDLFLHLLLDL